METANSPALLMLDLPSRSLAGIDLLSFTTSDRFRGVKDVPPGFHLVFVGTDAAFSERHGLWFRIPPVDTAGPSLCITKWNPSTETLEADGSATEILKWRANIGSIWREALTPYRQTADSSSTASPSPESNDWPSLTSRITPSLLSRILGSPNPQDWRLTSASSARRDLEDIPGLSDSDKDNLSSGRELHFLPIDLKRTWRSGATGRERTEAAQDRSWALEDLASAHCSGGEISEMIGELQFCFLMILTLNNFSCLEQWKRLLGLVLTCERAVGTRSDFLVEVLSTLGLQLRHCGDAEGGLIDLADESRSLLRNLLTRFRKGVEGSKGFGAQTVLDELDELEEWLTAEHGWRFGGKFLREGRLEFEDGEEVALETTAFDEDDETGEFAPQIVELTPDQARLLNLDSVRGLKGDSTKTFVQGEQIHTAVESSEDDDDDDDDDGDGDDDEDDDDEDGEEDMRDIEEMDSRY